MEKQKVHEMDTGMIQGSQFGYGLQGLGFSVPC